MFATGKVNQIPSGTRWLTPLNLRDYSLNGIGA